MSIITLILVLIALPHPGKATYYSPGLMDRVAHYRRIPLAGAQGFSTYPDCSKLGQSLVITVYDPVLRSWGPWESKRIVDCSQPVDYARHVREGLIELSYQDAVRFHYRREGHTLQLSLGPYKK